MSDSGSTRGRESQDGASSSGSFALPQGANFANRYKIERLLGRGGMGEVYLAFDQLLQEGEPIALKLLRPGLSSDERQTRRFFREVQLNRKISHPNVIRTFDVGQWDEKLYFTMEYIEGSSLKERISNEPIPADEVIHIISEIARGLSAIHESGIVHRDLKPANVMLLPDGGVKIADFGVAWSGWSSLTREHEIIGSAPYMAPELWVGRDVGPAADLYALGVVFYEALTGIIPFDGDSAAEMMCKHLDATPPAPSQIVPEVPIWLDDIVLRLLKKSAADRPGNAQELLELLRGDGARINKDESEEEATLVNPVQIAARVNLTEDEIALLSPAQDEELYESSTLMKPILPTVTTEIVTTEFSSQQKDLPPHFVSFGQYAAIVGISITVIILSMIVAPYLWNSARTDGPLPVFFIIVGMFFTFCTATLPIMILSSVFDGVKIGVSRWGKAIGLVAIFSILIAFLDVAALGIAPYRIFTSFSSNGLNEVAEMATTNSVEVAIIHPNSSAFFIQKDNGDQMLGRSRRPNDMRRIAHLLISFLFLGILLKTTVSHRLSAQGRWLIALAAVLPSIGYALLRVESSTELPSQINLPVGAIFVYSNSMAIIMMLLSWIMMTIAFWFMRKHPEEDTH